jgi:hypothetical protein
MHNNQFTGLKHKYHKEKTEPLLNATKGVGLRVNTGKTKYMFMSRHQTTGQNRCIKVTNKSFENVVKFKKFLNDGNKSESHSRGN